jgi:hypothetical protein
MELTLQIARLRPEASAQRTMQDNCLAFGHRDCQMRVYVGQGAADNRLRYWPRLRLMLAPASARPRRPCSTRRVRSTAMVEVDLVHYTKKALPPSA